MDAANTQTLDEFALTYAETKNSDTFDELFRAVKPRVDKIAVSKINRFEPLRVPVEDFKSFYYESVWEAADTYNGQSHFWQRLYTFIRQKDACLCRHYGERKRAAYMVEYLDEEGSYLMSEYDVGEMSTNEMLEGFLEKTSERNKQIINSLLLGYTKLEIAAALGRNEYDESARKAVQRARNKFRQYMTTKLAS